MRALLAISRALSLAPAPALVLALIMGPLLTLSAGSVFAESMDHAQWNVLLQKHVKSIDNGHSTALDYTSFALDKAPFEAYLRPSLAYSGLLG